MPAEVSMSLTQQSSPIPSTTQASIQSSESPMVLATPALEDTPMSDADRSNVYTSVPARPLSHLARTTMALTSESLLGHANLSPRSIMSAPVDGPNSNLSCLDRHLHDPTSGNITPRASPYNASRTRHTQSPRRPERQSRVQREEALKEEYEQTRMQLIHIEAACNMQRNLEEIRSNETITHLVEELNQRHHQQTEMITQFHQIQGADAQKKEEMCQELDAARKQVSDLFEINQGVFGESLSHEQAAAQARYRLSITEQRLQEQNAYAEDVTQKFAEFTRLAEQHQQVQQNLSNQTAAAQQDAARASGVQRAAAEAAGVALSQAQQESVSLREQLRQMKQQQQQVQQDMTLRLQQAEHAAREQSTSGK